VSDQIRNRAVACQALYDQFSAELTDKFAEHELAFNHMVEQLVAFREGPGTPEYVRAMPNETLMLFVGMGVLKLAEITASIGTRIEQ
jgi:hypothetical protein